MSEYQFYEFLAVDRPLDARQLGEVRALSTRAEITPTSFVNVYHWGDFRGDPHTLMERHYDAFLYLSNWGTRQLMIRLPAGLLDPATAETYCLTDSAVARTSGANIIVTVTRDGDGDDELDEDGYGRLGSIVSVRSELAAGDLRLLYLAWLHSVGEGELDDDELEPPVPGNLGSLSAGLRSFVDFIRLDSDLLDAAAEASRQRDARRPSAARMRAWVRDLPSAEKDSLIVKLMDGDAPRVGAQLLRRFHGQPSDAGAAGGRTVGQLLVVAQQRRDDRARLLAQERERQRVKRDRDAAAAREWLLDGLAREGERAWQRVSDLIDAKKVREYDAAVTILLDLRALGDRDGNRDVFDKRVHELRWRYANRPALHERLDHADLKATTSSLGTTS